MEASRAAAARTPLPGIPTDHDGSAYLLRELGEARREITHLKQRIRRLTISRDKWKERARTTPPERAKYRREWMRKKRAA